MVMGIAIISCKKDDDVQVVVDPPVNVPVPVITITTPSGGFKIDNLKWLKVNPEVKNDSIGASYLWTIGSDTIATTKNLMHVFATAGTYTLSLSVKNIAGTAKQEIVVTVADKKYTNGVVKVFDYFPAPGQFVNTLPEWIAGDKEEAINLKAETQLKTDGMISLGGFGGYVVMGFDHTIINKPGQNSFVVQGNAFNDWSEAGVIQVAPDANGNGLPDDEWYEIAGSEYNSPETVHNYKITYYKPDENKVPMPDDMYMSDTNYIRWKDNQGQSGYLSKNVFNAGPYYPQWKGDSISFTGTKLNSNNIRDLSGEGSSYVSPPFSYGYADNVINDKAVIRISWAVDKAGNYVNLPGIDFIKVSTGLRAEAGWLGEISTEITGVKDLNLK